jgi:acyl carrier protein
MYPPRLSCGLRKERGMTVEGGFQTPTRTTGRDWNAEDLDQELVEKVAELALQVFDWNKGMKGKITPETSFVNDLNADSLNMMELIMEIEDVFDLYIPDEEAEDIQTVGDAVDFIQKHK